jgi:hypothetical protein
VRGSLPPPPIARDQTLFDAVLTGGVAVAAVVVGVLAMGWTRFWHAVGQGFVAVGHALPWTLPHVGGVLGSLLAVIGPLVLWALLMLAAGAAVRYHFRRQRIRQTVWYEIQLFQNDVAEPAQVRGVFDQLWETLYPRSRWVGSFAPYRWLVGPHYYTLAVTRDPAVDDQIHLLLGAPAPVMDRVLAGWQNVYQNVRFLPWHHGLHPPRGQYLRWGLRYRTWIRLTDLVSRYEMMPLEALLQALAREAWQGDHPLPPFLCTYTFTPLPTRRAWAALEQASRYAEWMQDGPAESAARSALTQVGRGRWQTEWRAATATYDAMQRIVGAWGLHNRWAQLQPRNVILWRRVFARWMAWGAPRVWPVSGGLTLWSAEAATFFGWPTGRLRIADLNRSVTRRMPAPRALPRSPSLALMRAEGGEAVGLAEADRPKNLLLLGIQGSGKSTTLLNLFKNDVRAVDAQGRPAKPVILFDIGKDTAHAALRLVPPDRHVIWFAPGERQNPWLIQPFGSALEDGTQVDHLLDLFAEVFGEDAIGPRSRQILGHVFATVIAASTPDHPPTFGDAYRMLVDETFRNERIAQAVMAGRLPEHTATYWSQELPQLLLSNPAFWEEAVSAPRNKLDGFLRNEALRGALGAGEVRHLVRRAIDWERVIRERQVVIVNLDEAHMSRQAVALFGVTTTMLIWHAIQRQGLVAETARTPVSLLYDEAQEYLSPQFVRYLALGRAYGFQTALCTRFLLEIEDDRLRAGLVNLCQNRVIHRIPEEQDAKALMLQMMTIYMNNITLAEEAQALERFMADDVMRLPDRHAICVWQAGGVVQHPFNAETIDWRPDAHEEWARHHLAHQHRAIPERAPETPPPPSMAAGPSAGSSGPATASATAAATTPVEAPPPAEAATPDAPATLLAEDPVDEDTSDAVPMGAPVDLTDLAAADDVAVEFLEAGPRPGTADAAIPPAADYSWADLSREFQVADALAQRLGRRFGLTPGQFAAYLRSHPERPAFQTAWVEWLASAHDLPKEASSDGDAVVSRAGEADDEFGGERP